MTSNQTKKQRKNAYQPSPILMFVLIILLLAAICSITLIQNRKIYDLQFQINYSNTYESTENEQVNVPVCDRKTESISNSGSSGSKVLTREGNQITLENQPGLTFRICPNAKTYDIETGEKISTENIQPGVNIYFKTTEANYIKELQLLP